MLPILIGALCLAAVVAIVAVLSDGELDDTGWRALGTAVALSLYTLAGMACLPLGDRRPELALLGQIGAVTAALGLVITVLGIWIDPNRDVWWEAIGIALVISLALAHVCLLMRRDPRQEGRFTGVLRVCTVGVTALLALLLVVEISGDGEEVDAQALGVVAILYVLGTVLLPLVRRLESERRHTPG
jgi:hypothetical protein